MTEKKWTTQKELKEYLSEEITCGRASVNDEEFTAALKACTDDEFLYLVAENGPQGFAFSIGDIAAAGITAEEYRYALICSTVKGRRTLIHNLSISGELDEMSAARILLCDPEDDNTNAAMRVTNSEALLMLACLKSYASYGNAARTRLKEIGSAYPERFSEAMGPEEKEAVRKDWIKEACVYAERLIERDREMDRKVSDNVDIYSTKLFGFLAACHPDPDQRAVYANFIDWEPIEAYAGVLTEYADVRRILSRKIHREDLIDALPYNHSFDTDPYLIREREENRIAFCMEVLRNTDSEETRAFLLKRMKDAEIEIPGEFQNL